MIETEWMKDRSILHSFSFGLDLLVYLSCFHLM